MSDMIERVAKAMAFDQGIMWDTDIDEWPGPDEFIAMAVAAIGAMSEPTEDMLSNGSSQMRGLQVDQGHQFSTLKVGWKAMIDAALNPNTKD